MLHRVYLKFEDGKRDLAEEIRRLDEAMTFALRLADDIGRRPAGNGNGPPKSVEIYSGTTLEITIQITPGGLLGRKGAPKWRST